MKSFRVLLYPFLFLIAFLSCDSLKKVPLSPGALLSKPEPITTNFGDAATEKVLPDDFGNNMKAEPMTDLPRGENGGFLLRPGLYEMTCRSYCLHAGTAAPGKTKGDGYLFAPLKGDRAEIIKTIINESELQGVSQYETQTLIWAVLSKASVDEMGPSAKQTALQLLSKDQVKELNKNAVGVLSKDVMAKLMAQLPPTAKKALELENQMREKLSSAQSSYEDLERLAVLPAEKNTPVGEYKRGRWSRHPDGYFIRYFPNGYQEVKMQIYMPERGKKLPATGKQNYTNWWKLLNNGCGNSPETTPTGSVAVPSNENQQRLATSGQPKNESNPPASKKSELIDDGAGGQKFADPQLEEDYKKYLARKQKEKKPPRERHDWQERVEYFMLHTNIPRGNAFNKKARDERWYRFDEVALKSKKIVDSYAPGDSIVSRKATDFDDITEDTYRKYLSEMVSKYSPGEEINSAKYPVLKTLNGGKLAGKMYLEIPETNKCFKELEKYISIAREKNITLSFKPE